MKDKDSLILENLYSRILLEKIFGNTGWVYHRTSHNPADSDISTGIKLTSSSNVWYGSGFYSCYDFNQQLKYTMKKQYGKYIIKGKINLNGFAILDESVYYTANPTGNFENHLIKIGTNLEELKGELPYTSKIAKRIWERCKLQNYNGMIFTGEVDGKVAVIWNRRNFIPFSYTSDDGKSWEKLDVDISTIKSDKTYKYDKDRSIIPYREMMKDLANKEEIKSLDLKMTQYSKILFLKKLKRCIGDFTANTAKTVILSNLQSVGGRLRIPSATTVDLSNLRSVGKSLEIPSVTGTADLHNLQSIGGILQATESTTLILSNLRSSSGSIYTPNAETIDLSNLQTIDGAVAARNAKKIIIPKHLVDVLHEVSEECKIIHPEEQ